MLIGIVAGIIVLIVVALVVTLTTPEPTYLAEDNPEGVAHNYILALQRKEYGRAYGYLSQLLPGYPDSVEIFTQTVLANSYTFRIGSSEIVEVDSTTITGDYAEVWVSVTRFRSGDLFDSGVYSRSYKLELRLINGDWKIAGGNRYFRSCWGKEDGCD